MRKEFVRTGKTLASLALLTAVGCSVLYGQQTRPLTNTDVIRLLRDHEAEIVASIQAHPAKFDLSPGGLAALRKAGVSEEIIDAMVQQERLAQGPGSKSTPPTPAGTVPGKPPANMTRGQAIAFLQKTRNSKGRLAPIVTNPAAAGANAPTIAALQKQKQTALVERSQARPPAGRPQTPVYARASAARTAVPAAIPPAPSSGNSLGNRIAIQGNIAMVCTTFTSAMVQAVSGQSGGAAVFTQDPAFNPFTIKGCNFGNARGQAQLNQANGRKLADLTVDSWTDTLITVEVNPSLVDALDQNNVTLVLFPANGPQASKSGFRFYAMRREILLSSIPVGTVYLAPINDDAGVPVSPKYSSPSAQVVDPASQGMSAGVQRFDSTRFPGGTDVFSFANLKPGFVLEKFQMDEMTYYPPCSCCGLGVGDAADYDDGSWSSQIVGNSIRVSFAEQHCHGDQDLSHSAYAVNVWVVGPALSHGASPWQ
jgi:hypothetical protein